MRPTNPGADPLVPLIPISAIDPSDPSSWTYINNSNHIVDGKYLLGGTQQYANNPFAGMYAAGHNTYTSRQFQFDLGLNIDLARVLPAFRSAPSMPSTIRPHTTPRLSTNMPPTRQLGTTLSATT